MPYPISEPATRLLSFSASTAYLRSMSSRFAVATQILTVIASEPEHTHRSEDLAAWANTNPAVVRRLLQMLGRSGIIETRMGKGGGALLARAPDEIDLASVYRAVEDAPLLAMPRCAPDASCRIGANIGGLVVDAVARAQRGFEVELAGTTIGDLVAKIASAKEAVGG